MPLRIKNADFIWGCISIGKLPVYALPEIAMIGRSNVGKSSLINRMTGRRKLARTSSTPGRTQEFNLFQIAVVDAEDLEKDLVLVDLPGFGYAKYSKAKREQLTTLTRRYLSVRENLQVVCLLNDCRRVPEAEERAIQQLAHEHARHLLVVVTKIDKLKAKEKAKNLKAIAAGYGLEPSDLVVTGDARSTDGLWERVLTLL